METKPYINKLLGKLSLLPVVFALALGWHTANAEDSSSEVTEQVLDHHLAAFGSLDMDAILADYTDDSTILTPGGAVKGLAEIRTAFEGLFAEFGKPGTTFEMQQKIIEGNVAYIVWHAETADNVYELGTDTFVVRDGKIAVQSFTPKTTSKN